MNANWRKLGLLLLPLALAACSGRIISEDEVPRFEIALLAEQLDSEQLTVLDVRGGPSPRAPDRMIPGAVVEDPDGVQEWAAKYDKDRTLVLYCA